MQAMAELLQKVVILTENLFFMCEFCDNIIIYVFPKGKRTNEKVREKGEYITMKNCIVAQSGGPSCAINASLAGVIQGVLDSKEYDRIYGLINGITGVLNDSYMDLTEKFEGHPEEIELLKTTQAMLLGSCSLKLK